MMNAAQDQNASVMDYMNVDAVAFSFICTGGATLAFAFWYYFSQKTKQLQGSPNQSSIDKPLSPWPAYLVGALGILMVVSGIILMLRLGIDDNDDNTPRNDSSLMSTSSTSVMPDQGTGIASLPMHLKLIAGSSTLFSVISLATLMYISCTSIKQTATGSVVNHSSSSTKSVEMNQLVPKV